MANLLFTRRSRIPGSRFTPTDIEILKILERRTQGGKQSRVVMDIYNLYEKEPWLVQHVRHVRFNENEWFYFVMRTKLAGVKKAGSKRTSRRVGGSGRWKSTGSLTEIEDDNGVTVGSFQNISYLVKKGGKEEFTGWVMHEFLLNIKGFQQVSLCRLRFNLGKDNCNAPYAPLLQPRIIGPPPEEDDAPVVTPQQWNFGSCSAQNIGQDSNYSIHGDFGSYCQQHNQILEYMAAYQNTYLGHQMSPSQFPMMSQDLNGPYASRPYNQGMMQHGNFGSSSGFFVGESSSQKQKQIQIHGEDIPFSLTNWNGYSCPYSDHPYGGQQQNQILGHISDQVQYGQGIGDTAKHQNQTDPLKFTKMINAPYTSQPMSMIQNNQNFNSSGHFVGESSSHQQNQNFGFSGQFAGESSGQATHLSPLEQQQMINVDSGSYSALLSYDQGMMMEHQDFGSCTPCLAQNNQYLGLNNDLSGVYTQTQQDMVNENSCFDHNVAGDLAIQQKDLGHDSNLSLTQQCVDYTGQALDEEQQCVAYNSPLLAQPYDQGVMEHLGSSTPCLAQNNQSLGPNNDLSVVNPVEAEQRIEHENSYSDHNNVEDLASQQLNLGQDANLCLTQHQNDIGLHSALCLAPNHPLLGPPLNQEHHCDRYTSPSPDQAHDPQCNNNVESSQQKGYDLDYLESILDFLELEDDLDLLGMDLSLLNTTEKKPN